MGKRISGEFLYQLRNKISISHLIIKVLVLPFKYSEGYLRFLCPICSEFNTAVNPKTNLARCFRCKRNFNPIDMVMVVNEFSFLEAVKFLKGLLPNPNQSTIPCPNPQHQIPAIHNHLNGQTGEPASSTRGNAWLNYLPPKKGMSLGVPERRDR